MFERPKSATPRVTSPKPDTDTVAETLGAMKIEGDDTKVGSPKITQGTLFPPFFHFLGLFWPFFHCDGLVNGRRRVY